MSDEAGWTQSAPDRRRLAGVLVAGAAAAAFLLLHARAYAPILPLVATLAVITTASVALQLPAEGAPPSPGLGVPGGIAEIPVSCNAGPPHVCDPGVMPLRCLIVDDSLPFLAAARTLLEREGVSVVGVASTSGEALERVRETAPDVTLVDIDLGAESGFDVARLLSGNGEASQSKIILVSTHAEGDFADLIDASPAVGFLPKSKLSAGAIHQVLGTGGD